MASANVSGDHTLPLLVIGKAIKPRYLKNFNRLPVTYNAQQSVWMNSDLFYECYSNKFISKVKRERECKGRKGKIWLLLNNVPSYPSAEKLNVENLDFMLFSLQILLR